MGANGFCPKCGAIIHNDVCTSCGYGKGRFSSQQVNEQQTGQSGQQPVQQQMTHQIIQEQADTGGRYSGNAGGTTNAGYSAQNPQPQKSNKKTWVLVFVIIALCIIVPTIIIAVIFSQIRNIVSDLQEAVPEPEWKYEYEWETPSEDYYDWDEDYTYEEYVPSPTDDYLEEIVSSTVRGLSYDIAWNSSYIYADDDENYAGFYYYYPIVINSDAAYVDDINAAIYEKAMSYKTVSIEKENYGYVDAYVTYMSEDVLSVAFMYYSDEFGTEEYNISALNFDMTTGELIPIEEMIPQFEFMAEFRNTCEVQNGYYSKVQLDSMSDDEIMEAITNPETGVAFYSPVGVDIGFNYPSGWMTVTMKFGTY